ncbi:MULTISPECIES: amidase [unclassified Leucobacter]|uniref:amidase n=1 Tax=unclassified Leucobacter TaxID=2621730 RepID=UPI000699B785|nr:amidase [Leucobacter sp. Ag1]
MERPTTEGDDGIVILALHEDERLAGSARRGVLRGLRLAVKDNIDIAGVPTTQGSRIAVEVASATAPVVSALEKRGATTVAKVNLHEFAYGTTSANPWFGAVPNPARPDRIPGGSSGGSAAALAAGIADLALGTDTAGSIRMPAACVGVVGLRPRTGSLDQAGVRPLCPSFDAVGPLARTVADVVLAWDVLVDGAPGPAAGARDRRRNGALLDREPSPGPRIGLIGFDVDPATGMAHALNQCTGLDGLGSALEKIGARIDPDPGIDYAGLDRVQDEFWPAFRFEASRTHAAWFPARAEEYDPSVARKLAGAAGVEPEVHSASLAALARRRTALIADWDERGVDAVLTPTLGCPVPSVGADEFAVQDALGRFVAPWSALDLPALAIGGVQIVGRTEADVLALGLRLEAEGLFARPAP